MSENLHSYFVFLGVLLHFLMEDISITNIYGEKFIINVLHTTLKYSRYAHLEMTAQKRFDDVAR